MSTDPTEDRFIVLRHRDLRLYLAGRFMASLAAHVLTLTVGWQVFRISGSPLDLGPGSRRLRRFDR